MPLPHPPQWPLRLLRAWADPALLEDIEGDLFELFRRRVERRGLRAARLYFAFDALRFLRAYTRYRHPSTSYFGHVMLAHYVKVALRNLRRSNTSSDRRMT